MTPSALDVRVTFSVEETDVISAVNAMLVVPEATVKDAGTETAALLLASVTRKPVPGAALLKVIVQESMLAPEIEELLQVSELSAGTAPLVLPVTVRPPQPAKAMQLPRTIDPTRR